MIVKRNGIGKKNDWNVWGMGKKKDKNVQSGASERSCKDADELARCWEARKQSVLDMIDADSGDMFVRYEDITDEAVKELLEKTRQIAHNDVHR